jgi:hypothetical protein
LPPLKPPFSIGTTVYGIVSKEVSTIPGIHSRESKKEGAGGVSSNEFANVPGTYSHTGIAAQNGKLFETLKSIFSGASVPFLISLPLERKKRRTHEHSGEEYFCSFWRLVFLLGSRIEN